MNITILWSSLASYSVAFFRELSKQGCSIQLIHQPVESGAPYHAFDLSFCKMALEDSEDTKKNLEILVEHFNPHCILMSSWVFPSFMRLTKKLRTQGVYVVACMDNQWYGTLKQYLGVLSSRLFLKPSIDTFFVAGDRQAYFARKLGYENVLHGLLAADTSKFACDVPVWKRSKYFLFIGRLESFKGVAELVKAYQSYREQAKDPWGLKVAGTGPLRKLFQGVPGVELLGFVQPTDLPQCMRDARCFVLPSRWEPWGVVLHEATAAGLPVIVTYPCGAITMFARDGVNGYIVSPRSQQLTRCMVRMSSASQEDMERMSAASLTLSSLWNPVMLARYFIERMNDSIT